MEQQKKTKKETPKKLGRTSKFNLKKNDSVVIASYRCPKSLKKKLDAVVKDFFKPFLIQTEDGKQKAK